MRVLVCWRNSRCVLVRITPTLVRGHILLPTHIQYIEYTFEEPPLLALLVHFVYLKPYYSKVETVSLYIFQFMKKKQKKNTTRSQ